MRKNRKSIFQYKKPFFQNQYCLHGFRFLTTNLARFNIVVWKVLGFWEQHLARFNIYIGDQLREFGMWKLGKLLAYLKTRNTGKQNYGTWNTGGTPEHWRNNGILAEQSEYHGIVEHLMSSGTRLQQNNTKKYYQYRTRTCWEDNITKFKTRKLFYFSKKDFYGKVKPGQETVSM